MHVRSSSSPGPRKAGSPWPPGSPAPGVDSLPAAVPEDGGRLGVDGLVLEEVPLEGVERVVLIRADDGGQRLVQVLRLKLQRPERQWWACHTVLSHV